jgi:hypothetical protein
MLEGFTLLENHQPQGSVKFTYSRGHTEFEIENSIESLTAADLLSGFGCFTSVDM